ncbi:MAG TPA: autotransporter outer membrane beta-barrel domain-containing protein, partial [Stellaceae bacterium]|nr:autotransporter outer membrane beta-barrel domain-containing protein [Stellaceae bacterium]
ALDYDHTEASFADATSSRLDAYQAAAYVGWKDGPWYLNGLVGAGFDEFSTSRALSSFGLPGTASSKPVGETYFLSGEAGYRFIAGGATLTPYFGEALTHTGINGFTESGGFGALAVRPGTSDSFETTFGLRASSEVTIGDHIKLTPELRLGYQVQFLDAAQSLDASLGNLPFTATGANFGRNTALVGLGVTSNLNGSTRLFLDYDGRITGGLQEHALSAGVLVKF